MGMTALNWIDFAKRAQLFTREGKSELSKKIIAEFGVRNRKQIYIDGRDRYLKLGLDAEAANLMMVLDLAADAPGADELPEGLIESMRPELKNQYDKTDHYLETVVEEKDQERTKKRLSIDQMTNEIENLTKNKTLNMAQSVAWVTSKLRTHHNNIVPEEVPSMWAWTTYLWARESNETDYRKIYDMALIPKGGLGIAKDKGFVDDGKAMDNIVRNIKEGVYSVRLMDAKELEHVN